MLNVLDSTKDAYYNRSRKHIEVIFPNRNINLDENFVVKNSLKLSETIESGRELTFKGCNSNIFQIKSQDLNTDLRGEYVEAYVTANNTERIPLFKGYVADQTNQTHEDLTAELTCYDEIWKKRNVDVTSWFLGLTYPITVKNFRDSFFTHVGITQVVDPDKDGNTALINDTLTLKEPETTTKVVNAIDIMQGICQINGRYGQIGRDGNFHYRYLNEIIKGTYPSPTTYPSGGWTDPETGEYYPPLYPSGENADFRVSLESYISLTYEPYEVVKIDKVNILDEKGAVVGTYGNGDNALTTSDNIVACLLNNPNKAAENLYVEVAKLYYVPMQEKAIGLPFDECGDIMLTRTRKHIVRSYILKRVLTGEQSMFDTFTSQGNQYRAKYRESEQTGVSANRQGVKENADKIVADEAEIRYIKSNYVKTEYLTANYITATEISSTYLKTEELTAKTIYAKQIKGGGGDFGYLNANCIQAGTISVEKLDSSTVNSWQLSVQKLTTNTLWVGSREYHYKTINIDGTTVKYLGTDAVN